LDYRKGQQEGVATASDVVKAWFVNLDEVRVGEITQRNVRAGVIEGNLPVYPLLGMTFLGQLEITKRQSLLELRQR
ncbi:MAG TPA: retroviral-like aspartic protease family protein, partial [Gammaproteobacteria bacterium]